MKTEVVDSYPTTSMAVYFDQGLNEVYQLVFQTPNGYFTRLDEMWRELDESDTSLEDLGYYNILPADWASAKERFDEAQFENRVMQITELEEFWAQYVDKDGEFV
jgi:hypothetical protein